MKKKIAILGSTGSIGKTLINIIKNDKKNFEITLLSANKNYKELLSQAKIFNVKNIIINNQKIYDLVKNKNYNKRINIYPNFSLFKKIFKKKNDFIMNSITGLDGLEPTISSIKFTKNILIANKEAIICGWNLISKELKKNNTNFIPIDSEHFSIWSLLQNDTISKVEKVYLTASGGPFMKYPLKNFKNISLKQALKHPNWSMGKKITIDSSTMMNKVFEIIEAKKIFNLSYRDLIILTHPKSYVHAILKLNNGLTKILLHEPDMKIPIFNSVYFKTYKKIKSKNLDIKILNNLEFNLINLKRFPLIKILKLLPEKNSLFETILITVNDYFVLKFLENKINYNELIKLILKYSNYREFQKYKKKSVKNVEEIYKLRNYVSLKLDTLGI